MDINFKGTRDPVHGGIGRRFSGPFDFGEIASGQACKIGKLLKRHLFLFTKGSDVFCNPFLQHWLLLDSDGWDLPELTRITDYLS